jgi:hypothetical protein
MRGATSLDWPTTIIAAFSFLLHFLAIGSIYSDWLDPVADYEIDVSSLVESMKNLPPPPPIEEAQQVEETKEPQPAEAKEEKKKAATDAGKGPMTQAQAAALSQELDQLEMATIGALAGLGPATEGVLRSGEVPTGALDQAAASSAGIGVGGLLLGGGGGAIRPGEAGGGLAGIGTKTGGGGGDTGTVQKVAPPKGRADTGPMTAAGGEVSDAARVIAGMRAGFRNCYNRGLATNPDSEGKISLSLRIGPGGEVQGVTATPSGNLPSSVVGCVKARASAAQFTPPQGGTAVIQVPVTFLKQ